MTFIEFLITFIVSSVIAPIIVMFLFYWLVRLIAEIKRWIDSQ